MATKMDIAQNLRSMKLWRRGTVGLIMPASQMVTEPLYYAIAPEGVSFYTSRLILRGSGIEAVEEMDKGLDRAIEELAQAEVDCIAYCCTVGGIVKGLDYEKSFWSDVEKRTGIKTTTALLAVMESLDLLNMHKLVITSPYSEEVDEAEKRFFEDNGYEILNIQGLAIPDPRQFAEVMPDEIYKFSKDAWQPGADGLFISCVNFNGMPVIEALEKELHVPVLTSHSAILWKCLKLLGIDEPIPGFGKLLSMGK